MTKKEETLDYFLLKKITHENIKNDDKNFIDLKNKVIEKYSFKLSEKDCVIYVFQEYFNCLVFKLDLEGKILEFKRYVRIRETDFS